MTTPGATEAVTPEQRAREAAENMVPAFLIKPIEGEAEARRIVEGITKLTAAEILKVIRDAEASALRFAAEVADIWAKTEAVEGEHAAFIASVVRFTAAKIAAQIRALAPPDARASGASAQDDMDLARSVGRDIERTDRHG